MDRTFSPQPETNQTNATYSPGMDDTHSSTDYSYSDGSYSGLMDDLPQTNRTNSPIGMDGTYSPRQLNYPYSPGMDQAFPGSSASFSSDRSFSSPEGMMASPQRGIRPPIAASTPQRGQSQMNRTFSPQRGPPQMDGSYSGSDPSFSPDRYSSTPSMSSERSFSSPEGNLFQRGSGSFSPPRGGMAPRMDRTFSPQRGARQMPPRQLNITHSPGMDRTYSGTDHSFSSSGSFSPPRGRAQQMDRSFSPQGGSYQGFNEGYSPPPVIPGRRLPMEGDEDMSDRTFSDRTYSGTDRSEDSGSSLDSAAAAHLWYLRETSPAIDPDWSLDDSVFEEGTFPMVLRKLDTQGRRHLSLDRGYYPAQIPAEPEDFRRRRRRLPKTPPPRTSDRKVDAGGTVKLSPHTPIISQFSRYGYTDPRHKILNIPPGDDLIMPSAMKKEVTVVSPGKENPLHLDVEVEPTGISQSQSGEHIICDIAVAVKEAARKESPATACWQTVPMTETARRYDKKHGMFTPAGVFKNKHYAVRNIFGASPRRYDYTPPPPRLDDTVEWEWEWLNKQRNAGPGLNTTFTKTPPRELNRTYDAGQSGSGLNRTFTKTPPRELNRTYDAGQSGSGLNRTFTKTPPREVNRTYDAGSSGANLNTTFTRTPPRELNRTYDAGPSGAGLNRTFTPPPELNRTYDAGPSDAGLNATFTRT